MALLDNATQVSLCAGTFGSGLDHPECVAWGLDGYMYAGGEAGQIYRVGLEDGRIDEYANAGGGFVGGLALDAQHRVYACTGGQVKRIGGDGGVETYSTGAADEPLRGPNYPAFDEGGNLYVSDSGGWKEDDGCIYKIAPGGAGQVWSRALTTFPNGLCLNETGDYLYVVMSVEPPRVDRVPILPDGSAGAPETVVELPGTVPDGVAFDTEGRLYISCYRPDRIYRFDSDGSLHVLADDYEGTAIAAPTNIAFCGADLDVLVSANLGRWHLSRYEAGATGIALRYPEIA